MITTTGIPTEINRILEGCNHPHHAEQTSAEEINRPGRNSGMCLSVTSESYTKTFCAEEFSDRNDKCRARQGHWIIDGIPKANEKSEIPSIISQLLCQRDRAIITRNYRRSRGYQHNVFHRDKIFPRRQVEGCNAWKSSGGLQARNSDPYCIRLTVGGDRVNYPVDYVTPTV